MRGQYWLGKAYYQAGEFVNAKNQYLRVLSKRPGLHSVHHDLGLAYFGMRHYSEAIDHVQQAIRANHSIYIYYLSLSRFFSNLHDETTALAVLDSAHQYDRSIPEIWIAKGDIHKSGERFEDALKAYQISSSYDSKNWKGYYKQGVVQYYLGRLNEALSSLELAHEIDSTQSEINHFLGLVHLKQEKVQMANFYLVKASMADGSNADILFHLGQSYSYIKKIQKAKLNFERSLEIEPNNSEALYALGQAYRILGEKEASQTTLEKFKQISDFEKSKKTLQKQISNRPKDLKIKKELATLFESIDDFKSAAEVWQQAAYFGDQNAQLELKRLKSELK